MIKAKHVLTTMVGLLGAVGCAGAEGVESAAPAYELDAVEETQLITSVNADGTWTADAQMDVFQTSCKPSFSWGGIADATFTGPSGKTRKMGVCGLRLGKTSSGSAKACSTVSDCSDAPSTLPSGGFRYCTAPNGVGTKYCYYRPGATTTYCAGTPANGGVAVAPGYYYKQFSVPGATTWISYACFEGCAATDPSSSSTARTTITDQWCDGF